MEKIEGLIRNNKANSPVTGGTRRTEKKDKIIDWINTQIKHKNKVEKKLKISNELDFKLDDFPESETGKDTRTITTSKNQVYFIDKLNDFIISHPKNQLIMKDIMGADIMFVLTLFKDFSVEQLTQIINHKYGY